MVDDVPVPQPSEEGVGSGKSKIGEATPQTSCRGGKVTVKALIARSG